MLPRRHQPLLLLLLLCSTSNCRKSEDSLLGESDSGIQGDTPFKQDLCLTLLCRVGEECGVEGRVARCVCAREETCLHQDNPVCGSDNRTYPSHCELHRQACLHSTQILVKYDGKCAPSLVDEFLDNFPKPFREEQILATASSATAANSAIPTVDDLTPSGEDEEDVNESLEDSEEWADYYSDLVDEKSLSDIQPPRIVSLEESMTKHGTKKSVEEESANHSTDHVMASTSQPPPHLAYTLIDESQGASPSGPLLASVKKSEKDCDESDFLFLRNNLLLYFHAKYGEEADPNHGKRYLVQRLFSALDGDRSGFLGMEELDAAEKNGPQYQNLLPVGCALSHLLTRGDLNHDNALSQSEFFKAFGFRVPPMKSEEKVREHEVRQGEQYQILCSLHSSHSFAPTQTVRWFREGTPIESVPSFNFKISPDASSLYLTPASMFHMGNFSCLLGDMSEVHHILVIDPPKVAVRPSFLFLERGESGVLVCDFMGLSPADPPHISWEKNLKPLFSKSSVLELKEVEDSDTGSYSCTLTSRLGTVRATSSVIVREKFYQPEKSLRESQEKSRKVVIFSAEGVKEVEGRSCELTHSIPATYFSAQLRIPTLCHNSKCNWSNAVSAHSGGLVYAADHQRLAVLHIDNATVVEILALPGEVEKLWYHRGTDTVWAELKGSASLMVLTEASLPVPHTLSHILQTPHPVSRIFLPENEELGNASQRFGYAIHSAQLSLSKIDLKSRRIVSSIDIAPHHCQPRDLIFIPTVGIVVLYCSDPESGAGSGQLVIDYVGDSVLQRVPVVSGSPLLAAHTFQLISVQGDTGQIFIQQIINRRLELRMTIDEYLPLSDWVVLPSPDEPESFLFATSPRSDTLIRVSLSSAKVYHLPAVADPMPISESFQESGVQKRILGWTEGWLLAVANSPEGTMQILSLLHPQSFKCSISIQSPITALFWR